MMRPTVSFKGSLVLRPVPAGLPRRADRAARRPSGTRRTGRLLDLGCGTGSLAVPLAPRVDEVVAVDPEPEMLAALDGPANVRKVEAVAEDVDESWGRFRLVTIGRAFHWMDGPLVMARLALVADQLALVGEGEQGEAQSVVLQTARELIGECPPAKQPSVRYADALAASPFTEVEVLSVDAERTWTVDQLIGTPTPRRSRRCSASATGGRSSNGRCGSG